jgi:hypothetical protein
MEIPKEIKLTLSQTEEKAQATLTHFDENGDAVW